VIDTTGQIDQVTRVLGTRTLAAGEARVLTISQTYAGAIEEVWDACTSPERIPRWFLPISGDLRPGGHYQLTGNASGTIERCEQPNAFAATWEFGGQVSWIEVSLAATQDGRTLLTLQHIAHVSDDLWAQFGPGAVGIGWDSMLLGLAGHLATGESVDQADAMAWMVSDDGRDFMTQSSERWYAASVAAGTDPAEARAAAERSTAAYTAAPEPS
jgi:uncharacterized protein YndB with AHSA1/START domain